jgi:hypothetical protein
MSLIEATPVDDLARSLFDAAVRPLADSRRASGQTHYFPTAPDPAATSYFEHVNALPVGQPHVIAIPGGGHAAGLIDALAAFWASQGEADLAAMAPALKEIGDAIRAEHGQESGDVDIYCYTMF